MGSSSVPLTIASMTSFYLYGTDTAPENVQDRQRASSITETRLNLDIEPYMDVVGKYANLFQTSIVQSFFDGSLDLSTLTDVNGETHVTFQEIIDAGIQKASGQGQWDRLDGAVSINQYLTDIGSNDFALRAYAFGTTQFGLSRGFTVFNIDANGVRSVDGGAMVPYQDNFDFNSSNFATQVVNDYLLADLVDPYRIGRKVVLGVDPVEANKYALDRSDTSYYFSDSALFNNTSISYKSGLSSFTAPTSLFGAANSLEELTTGIADGASYIYNNKNVVFANPSGSFLEYNSASDYYYDPLLANTFVGGEGDDTITVSGNDTVFGNSGNDTVVINHTDKDPTGSHIDIYLGSGRDTIMYNSGDGSYHDTSADVLWDSSTEDKILFNSSVLDGGAKVVYYDGEPMRLNPGMETYYVNADTNAVYYVYQDYTGASETLSIQLQGINNGLIIPNYHSGDAGVFASQGEYRVVDDINGNAGTDYYVDDFGHFGYRGLTGVVQIPAAVMS
jgi:hypothetical protein